MALNVLSVGLGGAIGAVLRYVLGLLPIKSQSGFPWITFFINILGAFCIGIIACSVIKYNNLSPRMVLFLKVGICGGFTTFSTFSLESYNLLTSGKVFLAILYMILSVILGVFATWAAFALVK